MNWLSGIIRERLTLCLTVWGFFLFNAGGALADGVVRDGLGAISAGRGGTNIAHSDNGVILLDNPAAMVNIDGHHLSEVSFDILFTDLHYSDPQNDDNAVVNPLPLGQVSFIAKSHDGRWAVGLGAFAPAGFGARFDLTAPAPIGGVRPYKSFGALLKILPGFACRLTDRLSMGGTFGVAVSHAEFEGPFFLQTGLFMGTPTLFDMQATGATYSWSLGLQYELSERTTMGAIYQSETSFELDGSVKVFVPGLGASRYDAKVDLVWPRSLGLGIKHELCANRHLSMDVIWFDWSHAFDRIDMQLTNATNPAFDALLGTTVRDQFPLDWHDSLSVRLGYEYFVTPSSVLRAGYAYHRNQIPEATLTPYIPAILEHAVSVGYGDIWCDWNIDLAYQFTFGQDRTVTTSSVVGGDFDSSKVEAQAHWLFLSFLRQF